jgi:hypothetical protein
VAQGIQGPDDALGLLPLGRRVGRRTRVRTDGRAYACDVSPSPTNGQDSGEQGGKDADECEAVHALEKAATKRLIPRRMPPVHSPQALFSSERSDDRGSRLSPAHRSAAWRRLMGGGWRKPSGDGEQLPTRPVGLRDGHRPAAVARRERLYKIPTLTAGLFAASMFFVPAQASAAQIGLGAVPEAASAVHDVQYGYGGPRFGYGHRGYGRPHFRGHGYGRGYGRGYGHGYGRGYGHGYGYGRRGGF